MRIGSSRTGVDPEAVLKRPEHLAVCGRSDEMVLETALNGRADVLVTLNVDDFAIASHFRLQVATPGAFLRRLQQEQD